MRTLAAHNEWRTGIDASFTLAGVRCDDCNEEMVETGPEVDGLTPVRCLRDGAVGQRQSHIEGKVRVASDG